VATAFGLLLPLTELAVSLALLPVSSAWSAALVSLSLLLLFIAAIAINMARGNRPDCRCFGNLRSSPVGWSTLARNGALAGVAAFIIGFGRDNAGPSTVAWVARLTTAERISLLFGTLTVIIGLAAAGCWFS